MKAWESGREAESRAGDGRGRGPEVLPPTLGRKRKKWGMDGRGRSMSTVDEFCGFPGEESVAAASPAAQGFSNRLPGPSGPLSWATDPGGGTRDGRRMQYGGKAQLPGTHGPGFKTQHHGQNN